MQVVNIPNDAPKIGDFYISENGVVYVVDDIIYSAQNKEWRVLLWNILKYEFLPCEIYEFREEGGWFHKRKIQPEEGNKYTLDKGYDCTTHTYLAMRDV